eukprot:7211297-Prymnesium_polylepis.2
MPQCRACRTDPCARRCAHPTATSPTRRRTAAPGNSARVTERRRAGQGDTQSRFHNWEFRQHAYPRRQSLTSPQ